MPYVILITITNGYVNANEALTVDCCLVISFFGIIFYISMGFIVFGQPYFNRFHPSNQINTMAACFIVAAIFLLFLIGMILLRRREHSVSIQRQNYVPFDADRQRRYSQVKGIPMSELNKYREE